MESVGAHPRGPMRVNWQTICTRQCRVTEEIQQIHAHSSPVRWRAGQRCEKHLLKLNFLFKKKRESEIKGSLFLLWTIVLKALVASCRVSGDNSWAGSSDLSGMPEISSLVTGTKAVKLFNGIVLGSERREGRGETQRAILF